jgi:hypothetical protein
MPRRKLRAARWIQHRTPRGSISVAGNPTDDKNACTKVSDARRRGFSFSNPDHPGSVVFCSVLHPCTLRDHHLASPRKFLNLYIIATGGPAWSHEVRGVPHQRPAVPNLLNDSAAIRRPVYGATFKLVVFPLPPGPLFTAKQHATKPHSFPFAMMLSTKPHLITYIEHPCSCIPSKVLPIVLRVRGLQPAEQADRSCASEAS